MMDIYTVSFFGHRQIENALTVENRLESIIRNLLIEKTYVEFLVGRNGEFDLLATSTVRRSKRAVRDDNSSLVLVLPYLTAEYTNDQASFDRYYDEVEVSSAAAQGHFKAAIQTRNREMIDRSDLVLCCIQHRSGGAYQSVQYALKHGKQVLNLAGT